VDRRQFVALAGALGTGIALPAFAGSSYPSRPIEFIVPWGPGGGSDQTARKLAKMLEAKLNVSLPIVNIPGGSGVSGLTKLLSAPADGYAIYLMAADTMGLLALTTQRWSMNDLQPLAILTQQRSALLIRQDSPLQSWGEVDAASRKGEIKVGIASLGSPEEAAVNFFKRRGNQFVAVPYQRPGERYSALLGGHIDLLFEQCGDVRSFVESKQMHPILLLANEQSSDFPDVPTSRAVGIDFVLDQYRGVMVRAGMDPAVYAVLVDSVRDVVASDEYAAYLREIWADPRSYLGPKESLVYIDKDLAALRAAT